MATKNTLDGRYFFLSKGCLTSFLFVYLGIKKEIIVMTNTFLTREQIAKMAPAVLETGVSAKVSSKYVHVPTTDLIDDMATLGWNVVDVKQRKTRKGESVGGSFGKHMVIFRNDNVVITAEDGETVYPQILLSNSHDGLSSFQFRAGLFRLICSNGLVIATKDFGSMTIRHKGYSFDELKKTVMGLVEALPVTVETLNKFREVTLTEEQKAEMALAALGIRFGEGGAEVTAEEILKPIRSEDEGNDLWTVFNVIQEKMVRGGFKYKASTGRNKTARSIKNFNRDIELNEKLYELAESYI